MPRTILGTRVLKLEKNHPLSVSSPSTTETNENRAALMVELFRNDDEPKTGTKSRAAAAAVPHPAIVVLEVKLSTGASSYGCTISESNAHTILRGCDGKIDDIASNTMLALGRLLLRGGDDDSNGDGDSPPTGSTNYRGDWLGKRLQNLTISFQYETTTDNSANHRRDLFVYCHETLANGMRRSIFQQKLERLGEKSTTSTTTATTTTSGLPYALAVGEALNRTLQEAEQLKSGRNHWKKTAEDLGRIQQIGKDTLLANFCKLRNKMIEEHQARIEALTQAHRAEKESLASAATRSNNGSSFGKTTKASIKQEFLLPDELANELFAKEEILALAQGRKLDADNTHHNTTIPEARDDGKNKSDTNNKSYAAARRKAVLKADEAIDMVQIRKEAREFERNRTEKRKRRTTETVIPGEEAEDNTDGDVVDQNSSADRNYKAAGVGRNQTKERLAKQKTSPLVKSGSSKKYKHTNSSNGAHHVDGVVAFGASSTAHGDSSPRGAAAFRARQKPERDPPEDEISLAGPTTRTGASMAPSARTVTAAAANNNNNNNNDDDESTSSESSWILR